MAKKFKDQSAYDAAIAAGKSVEEATEIALLADKEAADKAAKEKAEKEAADKAAKEKADKEAADKAALAGGSKKDTITKSKAEELAKQYAKSYPSAEVFYITGDGNVFLKPNHNLAVDHKNKNNLSLWEIKA